MAGLVEMIVNNPAIIKTIARQVGIDENSANDIISKLAPILIGGAKSNFQSDKDSTELIKKIESNNYADMFDKPEEAVKQDNLKEVGDDILAQLTGSKDNSREVAKHVENETGVSSSIIKSILPMLAPMIIGALTKSSSASTNVSNPSQAQEGSFDMTAMFVELIDQDNDGSVIDDVMGMASKFIFS
ncbi:MAG: DUF937 domain-containing protein [Epsilonproteobacteria bacterium]|nr:DUF937 domain-containing protein [Campylobacterota bacterium]